MLDSLIKLLGPVDRAFNNGDGTQSHWWSNRSPSECRAAREIDSDLYITPTYAYPDRVEGGQVHNICYTPGGNSNREEPRSNLMLALPKGLEHRIRRADLTEFLLQTGVAEAQIKAKLKDIPFPDGRIAVGLLIAWLVK